ncbi:hypothetical protein BH23CHL1_BH23CHL1_14050 [soil metagenome]
MTPKLIRMTALIAAVAMMAVATPVAARQQQVPFKARYAGTQEITSGPPILNFNLVVAGNATHLGKFTGVQHHVVDVNNPLEFSDGTYTFSAANGDTIFGGYFGHVEPLPNGDVIFHGAWSIEGGTGRFNDATGGGSATGLGHSDLTFTLELDGTITSVGSK